MTRRRALVLVCAVLGVVAGVLAGIVTVPAGHSVRWERPCPRADHVQRTITVDVSEKDRKVDVATAFDVEASGVRSVSSNGEPVAADPQSLDLRMIGMCLTGSYDTTVESVHWQGDSLKARVTVPSTSDVSSAVVTTDLGVAHSTILVRTCPHGSLNTFDREMGWLICTGDTTVLVRLRGMGDAGHTSSGRPPPQLYETAKSTTQYEWHNDGSPLDVAVDFHPTLPAVATTVLQSGRSQIDVAQIGSATIGLEFNFLAFAVSGILTLLVGSIMLRKTRWSRGLTLAAVGLTICGGLTLRYESLSFTSDATTAIVAVAGWLTIIVGLARRRIAVAMAVVAAAAVVVALAIMVVRPTSVSDRLRDNGSVLLAVLVTVVLVVAATLLLRRAGASFEVREENTVVNRPLVTIFVCLAAFSLGWVVAFPAGFGWNMNDASIALRTTAGSVISANQAVASVLAQLAPLVVVGTIVLYLRWRHDLSSRHWRIPVGLTALLLTLGAPWAEGGTLIFVIAIPLWVLQALVLAALFRRLQRREPDLAETSRSALLAEVRRQAEAEAEEKAVHGAGILSRASQITVVANSARDLLSHGPRDSRFENATRAATVAGYIAIAPVAYFVWTTIDQLDDSATRWSGALSVLVGLVIEAARWIVVGFVFGYLARYLPGRIGPFKALSFAAIWILGSLLPIAIARALTVDLAGAFVYRSAQYALFVVVLAIVLDVSTVQRAGGSWRDLLGIYSLNNYRDAIAAVVPAALLVITLAQQIAAGSGLDVAASFLNGITSVVK